MLHRGQAMPIAPCVVNDNPTQALNQLLEADIVYVRDFTQADLMNDEQLKHLALIAHHCYQSFDLALRCVMVLEQRKALWSPAALPGDVRGRRVTVCHRIAPHCLLFQDLYESAHTVFHETLDQGSLR